MFGRCAVCAQVRSLPYLLPREVGNALQELPACSDCAQRQGAYKFILADGPSRADLHRELSEAKSDLRQARRVLKNITDQIHRDVSAIAAQALCDALGDRQQAIEEVDAAIASSQKRIRNLSKQVEEL